MTKSILILSDLHHRISGVSASIRSLLPALDARFQLVFVAKKRHQNIQAVGLIALLPILWNWDSPKSPVWHVRRNNEMFWGLLFRCFICRDLKLVFTSAAIRRHSAWPRWLISKMDAVIATSNKAAELVPNVVSVLPHGVDIDRFSVDQFSSKYPWQAFKSTIGIVGRVRPEKGTDLFSESISRLLPKYPDACAVIIGKVTPKYRSFFLSLKQQWQSAGIEDRVFVVDEIDLSQMPFIYASLDIVCAPARYEGFGLVPIEAMVSGTAIVASKTGAYEDMITEGKNGYLFDVGSKSQLYGCLDTLLNAPNRILDMKSEGRKVVQNRFSLEHEVNLNCDVYHQLSENK